MCKRKDKRLKRREDPTKRIEQSAVKREKRLQTDFKRQLEAMVYDKRESYSFAGMKNEIILNKDNVPASVVMKDDNNKVFAYYEMRRDVPTFYSVNEKPFFGGSKNQNMLEYITSAIHYADSIIQNPRQEKINFIAQNTNNPFSQKLKHIVDYKNRQNQAVEEVELYYLTNKNLTRRLPDEKKSIRTYVRKSDSAVAVPLSNKKAVVRTMINRPAQLAFSY